jgi:hypothetical protein
MPIGQTRVGVQTEGKQTSMKFTVLMSRAKCLIVMVTVMMAGLMVSALAEDDLPSLADNFAKAVQSSNQSCQIMVQQNGTMVQNVGATKLSSQNNAGLPGLAEVKTTNGSYYMSIDRPNGFVSAPAGANTDVVFKASFSGHGKTNFTDTPGNVRVKMKNGVTRLDIQLEATKLSGAFPAGYYLAELTLRCD